MQVSQINSTNFCSKSKFLTKEGLEHFNEIKKKMGDWSVVTGPEFFVRTKLGRIEADGVLLTNLNLTKVMIGKSELTISHDGKVTIDKKPFLKSKLILMNKLEDYLAFFNNNFNNKERVEKRCIREHGYVDEIDGNAYVIKHEWFTAG